MLGQLVFVEVLPEAEELAQVVGSEFHRGLAYLVGRGGSVAAAPLEEDHRQIRGLPPELERHGEARQPATEDYDVVSVLHCARP